MDRAPPAVAECIAEVGFGFMFAPVHHQAMRHVVPVRRELAVRTIFNLLGPLTNPAGAKRQVIGVADPAYLETMAGALARLGSESALIVSAEDGLDELSVSAPTRVVELRAGQIASSPERRRWRRRERASRRDRPGDAGVARQAQARAPARRARAPACRPRRGTAVPGSARASGHVPDRRAQAALPVGRRDPRG